MELQINPLRLTCITSHAELMAKYGMPLTRVAPTLRETVAEYRLDIYARQIGQPTPRTWKQAAPMLREIKTLIDVQIKAEIAARHSALVN